METTVSKGARRLASAARGKTKTPGSEPETLPDIDRALSKSLRKALRVLKTLAQSDHPLLMAQLADRAQIARPTTYRLVQTLINEGFVIRNPIGDRLSIGYEVLPLAASVLDSNRLRMVALPHLDELAKKTGERVNLGIVQNSEVMYLGGIEKPTLPTLYSRFGRTVPAYTSSLGKAILAYLSEEEVRERLAGVKLIAKTPNTITSIENFLIELEEVRKNGYAVDREENVRGTFCMGTAIFDHENRPLCAISISGRSLDVLLKENELLKQTAERISHAL
jgi:IclR family KDG regulon transcriptional repressor